MNVLTQSEDYLEGGWLPDLPGQNIEKVCTAETDEAGAWWVVCRDGFGEFVDASEATLDQAARFELEVNPPAPAPGPSPEALAAAETLLGAMSPESRAALATLLAS